MAIDRNSVIKEAQKFASKGQYDKAIAEWRKLVTDNPHDANVYNTIGDLCLKKNAKSEAVDAYKRAADILAEDGFTSKAIALYKKVLNIDPARIDVHLALGDMNAEKGLIGNALENYKFVADFYKNQKNMAQALSVYQKMADLNPANVAFRIKVADMYFKAGMKREAVKSFLDAADVHIANEAFQEARQLFERALELDPSNKDVYHKAGIVYFREGKYVEACKALKPAFEANPENEELVSMYLEALAKAGRTGDAEEVYSKLLAVDPSQDDLRKKLYDIYLGKKAFDKALQEAVVLAEHKAAGMDFAGAAAILREFIAVTHDPVIAGNALAALFEKNDRARDGALELVTAADALIERGSIDDARELLGKALLLAPDLEEARQKLGQPGVGDGGRTPAASVEPEIPTSGPAAGEAIVVSPVEEAAAVPAEELPEVAEAEAATPPRGWTASREDPVVVEALAEVDVLVKYGLGSKAVEQLEGIARTFPDSLEVHRRLLGLYHEQKQSDKAVDQALLIAGLHEKNGREEERQSVLRAALERAPGNRQIMEQLGMAASEAEMPEVIETIEEPEGIEMLPDEMHDLTQTEMPDLEIPTLEIPEIPEDLSFPQEQSEPQVMPAAEPLPQPSREPLAADEIVFGEEITPKTAEPVPGEGSAGPPSAGSAGPEREAPVEEGAGSQRSLRAQEIITREDVGELWSEAEFYYQQGLFDEARRLYERVIELKDGDPAAEGRLIEIAREKQEGEEFARLAEAVENLESAVTDGSGATVESVSPVDAEAVRTLMQDIDEMRKTRTLSSEDQTRISAPPSSVRTTDIPEESFADLAAEFRDGKAPLTSEEPDAAKAEDGDFFDLAAELRDELSTAPASSTAAPAQEQSLDDIFEEFKKGVEDHEKKEDEDTHYNLGVAYREMGLLDDAISEFNMTNEGEPKFIQSRYMLGLCFLEKGDFETAITEIQNALGYSYSFGEASEVRIGMHYDLGLAYQGVGNTQAALEEFQKVHNLDPSYREVATKVTELQEGDFISLDSIKEDIEKEVSFKFLEEGARIEREEKTKKTKK